MSALRLVAVKGIRVFRKRPVVTEYNGGYRAHSTSVKAAIKAATRRILDGDYGSATIYDEKHVGPVAWVDITPKRLQVTIRIKKGAVK